MKFKILRKVWGFTLVELLIVICIIGLIFSVVVPFSQARYERYRASVEAEKVLLFLSEKRREAFLYGKEIEINSKDGSLVTYDLSSQNQKIFKIEGAFLEVKEPFKFYPLGTTNGGKIYFYYGKTIWLIEVTPLFGEIILKEKTE